MPTLEERRHIGMVVAGRTDVGLVRAHNEDAYLVAALGDGATATKGVMSTLTIPPGPAVLVVAGGVGGAASGEIASLMATDTILIELRRRYERGLMRDPGGVEQAMRDAMDAANHVIYTYASGNPHHRGMATTATLAVVQYGTLYVAQVGDSRAYLVHDGGARQLTKDQSLVQRLLDAGEITEAQAEHSDRRNIILQALGSEPSVMPDLYKETPAPGDVLVLCSDGLSNQVGAQEIAGIALTEPEVAVTCERLVASANARGGHDNITVVTARFTGVLAEVVDLDATPEPASPGLVGRVRRWLQ